MRRQHSPHHFASLRALCGRTALIVSLMMSLLGSLSSVEATVARRATVKSLTAQADLIIHARVSRQWTPKARGPQGQIYTYTELTPISVWHGEVKRPLILVQLGGQLGELRLEVHGDAKLSVGQEAVFFLTSRSRDRLPVTSPSALQMVGETATGAHSSPQVAHLISLAQSVFFVNETNARGEVSLRQDLDGLVFYAPQADTLSLGPNADESQPTLWSLNSLRAHVKALTSGGQ